MTSTYQTLLGLSSVNAESVETTTLDVDVITVHKLLDVKGDAVFERAEIDELYLPSDAEKGYVLTSDDRGNATWQEPEEAIFEGDTTGDASANRVDTLAGGTISVDSLVTLTGTQTLTNKTVTGTTNIIEANRMRNGSTWIVPYGGSAPAADNVLTYNGNSAI